jgi:hypothetical protein
MSLSPIGLFAAAVLGFTCATHFSMLGLLFHPQEGRSTCLRSAYHDYQTTRLGLYIYKHSPWGQQFFVQSLENTVFSKALYMYYGKIATVGRQVWKNSRREGDRGSHQV